MSERTITIKIRHEEDLRQLQQLLLDAPSKLREQLQQVIIKGAQKIRDDARSNAPVKTGYLRSWIRTRTTSEGAAIYSSAPYSWYVEQGHLTAAKHIPVRFIPGQYFMKNAVDMNVPLITAELDQTVLDYFSKFK